LSIVERLRGYWLQRISLVHYEGGYLLPNQRFALFDGFAPLLADVLGEFGVKADHRARA
jgi:hypothetical protein